MIEGSVLRTWLAAVIAAATTALVFLLSRDLQISLVTLVGSGAAAIVAATIGDDRAAPAAEAEERAPAAPLDTMLEAFSEPVLVVRDGRIARANAAARSLLGAHAVGEDVRVAIRHPAAADLLSRTDVDVPDAGEAVELVGLGARQQRWQMRVAPLGAGERLVHLVDETGRYAAERMRVDFVANASHELRTPLASILGYVETLDDEAGEDAGLRRRFLGIVMAEARRMQQLIDDLMSLSRIEAEKFRLPDSAVDLAAVARDVEGEIAQAADRRAVAIALDIAPGLPPVLGDAAQLSQVLHNLVGNAIKYGRADGAITVSLRRGRGDAVCLEVADQGDGIAPEHLPRLTERFYRVDAGRSRSIGGTGLGLAIVKHIVERHRGRLDIASEVGVGTRVTVTLRAAATQPLPSAVMTAS